MKALTFWTMPHQIYVPYSSGEFSEVGDHICDLHRRYGVVTHIIMWGSGQSELVVEWEDGTIGIRYTAHEDFELLDRRDEKDIVLTRR